jgi:hypothetical protein
MMTGIHFLHLRLLCSSASWLIEGGLSVAGYLVEGLAMSPRNFWLISNRLRHLFGTLQLGRKRSATHDTWTSPRPDATVTWPLCADLGATSTRAHCFVRPRPRRIVLANGRSATRVNATPVLWVLALPCLSSTTNMSSWRLHIHPHVNVRYTSSTHNASPSLSGLPQTAK